MPAACVLSAGICSKARRKATRSRALPEPELRRPRVRSRSRTSASCWRKLSRPKEFSMKRPHGLLPPVDRGHGGQRLGKPLAQPPRAHGRDRAVERAVERGIARRVMMQRFENFQMPQRSVIERQKIAALVERDAREMFHVAAQILGQVVQHAARRADGGGLSFSPKPSSVATLKCSRTVKNAVSGAKVQSS